jgi:hypothetical protein
VEFVRADSSLNVLNPFIFSQATDWHGFRLVSMNATTKASCGPVRLLSLDGGGVRGLSELVLLEQIMDKINTHRTENGLAPHEPWEAFDMIGGTSTGGYVGSS